MRKLNRKDDSLSSLIRLQQPTSSPALHEGCRPARKNKASAASCYDQHCSWLASGLLSTPSSSLPRAHYVNLFPIPHSTVAGFYVVIKHGEFIYTTEIDRLQITVLPTHFLFRELVYQHTNVWPSSSYLAFMQTFSWPLFPDLLLSFILLSPFLPDDENFPHWFLIWTIYWILLLVFSLFCSTFHTSAWTITFFHLVFLWKWKRNIMKYNV